MTSTLFAAAIIAELFLVAGQVITTRSMLLTNRSRVPWPKFAILFATGVAGIAVYFFLWLGLMQRLDLSQQYPFDAMAPLLLVFAATIFLKERLTLRSWIGIALICTGLVIVAFS